MRLFRRAPLGRVTHHLMLARQTADPITQEHIDNAIILLRRVYHRRHLREVKPRG